MREDRLLEVLPGLLADRGGIRSGPVAGGSTPDPVEVLRHRRLQIACTHQGQQLWREAPGVITSVRSPQGQTALALDWTPNDDAAYQSAQPDGARQCFSSANLDVILDPTYAGTSTD